jgi:hypothetical protein
MPGVTVLAGCRLLLCSASWGSLLRWQSMMIDKRCQWVSWVSRRQPARIWV